MSFFARRRSLNVLPLIALAIACTDCASSASQPTVMVDGQHVQAKDTIDADTAQAIFDKAKQLFDAKDFPAAKRTFAEVLLKAPTSQLARPARRYFASAALQAGDYRDAAEALKQIVR